MLVSFLLLSNSISQSSSVYRGGVPLAVEEFFPLCCFFYSSVNLLLTPSGRAIRDSFGELKLILSKFGCTQHSANKFASAFVCTNFPVVASSAVASHSPLRMRSTGFSILKSYSFYRLTSVRYKVHVIKSSEIGIYQLKTNCENCPS